MVFSLLKLFWEICLLRAPPQRIPKSWLLQGIALTVYVAASTAVASIDRPLWNALLSGAVDTFLLVGLTHVALWVRDHPERSTQTVTALAGSSALIGFIALPLLASLHDSSGAVAGLQGLLWLGLVVWSILIMGHILRHAMSIPFLAGNMVALVYVYISFKVMNALFLQVG